MSMEAVLEQMTAMAAKASPLGGTLKFVLDGNPIFIDGNGSSNDVSTENKDADCTITTTVDVLNQLRKGELNPMGAVMSGKVKIDGSMGLAMKLQSLLGG